MLERASDHPVKWHNIGNLGRRTPALHFPEIVLIETITGKVNFEAIE
jgi:hypothetical protein